MLCPSHPPWLDHSNYAWRRVQVMNNNLEKMKIQGLYLSLGWMAIINK
jgi:hypothetical protein